VWKRKSHPKFQFDIDVLGSCNLRCPSCPVGNSPAPPKNGLMSPDTLRDVMTKAVGECSVTSVSLFNWTEPLLHPKLAELVRIVRSHDVPCHLSSNLNVMPDIDELVSAGPTSFRISLSGFDQETYGITHRNGNIGQVKENMRLLADARARAGSDMGVHVLFHRYLGNHQDEAKMLEFCDSLGFELHPVWAYFMPLEKNLAFLGDESIGVEITEDDRSLIDRLALRPDEASAAAQAYKEEPCGLLKQQLTLNSLAEVQLCCTTFDQSTYGIASYLTTPLEEIQAIRRSHTMCTKCMDKGLHVVAAYGAPEFELLAQQQTEAHHPDARLGSSITAVRSGLETRFKHRLKRWLGAFDHQPPESGAAP
jgi:pyruvate-formate lyase-activating enzyme